MKNPYTVHTRYKTELILSLVTLILVATLCVAFQHMMLKKTGVFRTEVRSIHHVVIEGKHMTASEKLAFDQEPQKINSADSTGKKNASVD